MEQYTDNQYDDDLTDGSGDYDDSYYTGAEDLFDYTPDEESPISRLKSLVLSIDWEITDDVLLEFNEELVDLKDIWAGEKIFLIYVQALEKLSKYIYQKKAESHPSAIKLLLTLYHNLEKIVSSDDLSEAEKKAILLEDVKRFENLKSHLKTNKIDKAEAKPKPSVKEAVVLKKKGVVSELLNLKAIVLGIDWEITDEDLSALRHEVVRLEKMFADSRPKLILLQGIGTIGAYIKVKKSDAHADAFKVLHLFYGSLEKIVDTPMSIEEEKAILFPAVERFNTFKALLGETISAESISRAEKNGEGGSKESISGTVAPAFSDLPEDEMIGFQADKEAAALGIEDPDKVNDHVANFFGEDSFVDEREPTESLTDTLKNQIPEAVLSEPEVIDKNIALQGVDVEEGDEDDDTGVTPALSFGDDITDESPIAQLSDSVDDIAPAAALDSESEEDNIPIEVTFPDDAEDDIVADFSKIDKNVALQGVDVESEADDDSDEDDLPLLGGELAPALADNEEVSVFNAETLAGITDSDTLDDEIASTVLDFFEEDGNKDLETVEVDDVADQKTPGLDGDLSVDLEAEAIGHLSDEEDLSKEDFPAGYQDFHSDSPVISTPVENEKQEEDLSSDIESQLDDFFGSDVIENQVPSQEVFEGVDEEEVVFELVEDDADIPAVAAMDGAVDQVSGTPESVNILDSLAPYIEATGIRSEASVVNGLLDEINIIEKQWIDKPLEKTFLHLLRTIGYHIYRHRHETGSAPYDLLKSVFDALLLSQTAIDQRQDLLLAQTVRVLDWQQDIITADNVENEDISVMPEPASIQEQGSPGDQMLTFEDELLDGLDSGKDDGLKSS